MHVKIAKDPDQKYHKRDCDTYNLIEIQNVLEYAIYSVIPNT